MSLYNGDLVETFLFTNSFDTFYYTYKYLIYMV